MLFGTTSARGCTNQLANLRVKEGRVTANKDAPRSSYEFASDRGADQAMVTSESKRMTSESKRGSPGRKSSQTSTSRFFAPLGAGRGGGGGGGVGGGDRTTPKWHIGPGFGVPTPRRKWQPPAAVP